MSLFRAREWYRTKVGGGREEFSHGCFVVANIDNSDDGAPKIVTGSLSGYLRIHYPKGETDESAQVMEMMLDHPVLQLECGRFSPHDPHRLCLAVLHPRRLVVYAVVVRGANLGGAFALEPLQNHALGDPRGEHFTAFNMVSGPFGGYGSDGDDAGGGAPGDALLVQAMDGKVMVFEHGMHAFSRRLNAGGVLPGPLCYVPKVDALVTGTADGVVECYKYKALAEIGRADSAGSSGSSCRGGGLDSLAADFLFHDVVPAARYSVTGGVGDGPSGGGGLAEKGGGVDVNNGKREDAKRQLRPEWRCKVGDTVLEIRVGRVSGPPVRNMVSSQSSRDSTQQLPYYNAETVVDIIVLCEHSLLVLSESSGSIRSQRRLDVAPSTLCLYDRSGSVLAGATHPSTQVADLPLEGHNLMLASFEGRLLVFSAGLRTPASENTKSATAQDPTPRAASSASDGSSGAGAGTGAGASRSTAGGCGGAVRTQQKVKSTNSSAFSLSTVGRPGLGPLVWSAVLPTVSCVGLAVASFGACKSLVACLDDSGLLTLCYLGTDPPTSAVVAPSVAPLDFGAIDEEHRRLLLTIRKKHQQQEKKQGRQGGETGLPLSPVSRSGALRQVPAGVVLEVKCPVVADDASSWNQNDEDNSAILEAEAARDLARKHGVALVPCPSWEDSALGFPGGLRGGGERGGGGGGEFSCVTLQVLLSFHRHEFEGDDDDDDHNDDHEEVPARLRREVRNVQVMLRLPSFALTTTGNSWTVPVVKKSGDAFTASNPNGGGSPPGGGGGGARLRHANSSRRQFSEEKVEEEEEGAAGATAPLVFPVRVYARKGPLPDDLTGSCTVCWACPKTGETRTRTQSFTLPLSWVCGLVPPSSVLPPTHQQRTAQPPPAFKLTLDTNRPTLDLAPLFDDMLRHFKHTHPLAATKRGCGGGGGRSRFDGDGDDGGGDGTQKAWIEAVVGPTAKSVMTFRYLGATTTTQNGSDNDDEEAGEEETEAEVEGGGRGVAVGACEATILVSKNKTAGRYRVQSTSLPALWMVTSQLCSRLRRWFAAKEEEQRGGAVAVRLPPGETAPPSFEVRYSEDPPFGDFFAVVEAHLHRRRLLLASNKQLRDATTQLRVVQKRLLVKFKDRNPQPLRQLDLLMEHSHRLVLGAASQVLRGQRRLRKAGNELACVVGLMHLLIALRFRLNPSDAQTLAALGCLSPTAVSSCSSGAQEKDPGGGVGWEEVADAALTHLLRTTLVVASAANGDDGDGDNGGGGGSAALKSAGAVALTTTTAPTELSMPEDTARLQRHLTVVCDRLYKGATLTTTAPPQTPVAAASGRSRRGESKDPGERKDPGETKDAGKSKGPGETKELR